MIQFQLPITFKEFAAFWMLMMVIIIAVMLICEHINSTNLAKRNRNGFN